MSLVPAWIRNYQKTDLKPDVIAGLTVGIMLIPQGMAYALLAGLPPIYGLYASTVPMVIYALLGSSPHLSVGPVAMDSLLTAASVGAFAVTGSAYYISIAILLAFVVGAIQFGLGITRLGFLVKFLSHPVIIGFTSAAAIIIGLSQISHLLGISMRPSPYLQDIARTVIAGIHEVHLPTIAIGLGGIFILIAMRKGHPGYPGPLIIVAFSILIVSLFDLHEYGVKVVGSIPSGFPSASLPVMNGEMVERLLPSAFAIALIGFMESLAIARALQAKHRTYKINTDRELISLGLANMVGSIFKSFPVSGGFSRSAINEQAGARTGLASIVSVLLVVFALLFLTGLLQYLPNAVLASIIIVAVSQLIHLKEAKYLWQVDRVDFVMMLVTFLGTLFLGIGTGIAIGVLLSLAWIIFQASYPHSAELGRIPGTNIFRNVRRFKDLEVDEDTLIFRFDAPLFFANIDRFRDQLLDHTNSKKPKIKTVIVDMESINTIDTSAMEVFKDLILELRDEDVLLLVAEIKGPVRDKLVRSGLSKIIGEENFFITVDDAMDFTTGEKQKRIWRMALQANKYRRL